MANELEKDLDTLTGYTYRKKVKKLSSEEIVAFGNKHKSDLLECVKEVCEQLPEHIRPTGYEWENEDSDELSLIPVGCGFSIDLVTDWQESIARKVEVCKWQLTGWKHYPATRMDPPDCVDVPISLHPNHWSAAQALVTAIFNDFIGAMLEAKAEAEAHKEWESDLESRESDHIT